MWRLWRTGIRVGQCLLPLLTARVAKIYDKLSSHYSSFITIVRSYNYKFMDDRLIFELTDLTKGVCITFI